MIIAYCFLNPPLPFSLIEAKTGVAKSTCHNIYKHALQNVRKKCELEDNTCQPILAGAKSDAESNTIQATECDTVWVVEQLGEGGGFGWGQGMIEQDSRELELGIRQGMSVGVDLRPVAGTDSELGSGAEPGSGNEQGSGIGLVGMQETEQGSGSSQPGVATSPEIYSLLDLISADVLDPNTRTGRPSALTREEKKQLVKTVKRSFTTRRMQLVDL